MAWERTPKQQKQWDTERQLAALERMVQRLDTISTTLNSIDKHLEDIGLSQREALGYGSQRR